MLAGRPPQVRLGAGAIVLAVIVTSLLTQTAASSNAVVRRPSAEIQLRPAVGPPTSATHLSGAGFGSGEQVDVTFDSVHVRTVTTDAGGAFAGRFRIPADAAPGDHDVTATGGSSGFSARASFLVRANWRNFHFDHPNSGSNPYENVLDPSNVGGLTRQWVYSPGDLIYSSPAIADGMLFVGAWDGSLHALDAETGAPVWSYATPSPIDSSPAVGRGIVYVGSFHRLYAVDEATGSLRWSYPIGRADFASPTVAGGLVFIGGMGGTVYAVHAGSGSLAWTYRTGGHIESSPAVADGVVYVSSGNGKVYALDAATGTKLWAGSTQGLQYSSPAVVHGTVFIGSFGGIYAFDASTGRKLWRRWLGDSVQCSPAVAGGVVYTGNRGGEIFALDAANGHVRWKAATGGLEIFASPAVANGVVYVASKDGTAYAFDAATGTRAWQSEFGDSIVSSPAVVNGKLYFGQFHALVAYGLP